MAVRRFFRESGMSEVYCSWVISSLCLTSQVWAAWAQAVLSAAAIFAAVRIAAAQSRRDELRRQREDDQTRRHTKELCDIFAAELRNAVQKHRSEAETQRRDLEAANRAILRDVVALGREIDLARVPHVALDAVLTLRQLAVETEQVADALGNEGAPNWHHWSSRFQGLHELVTGKMLEMERRFAEAVRP